MNKINQTEETQRWVIFGYGSDDFWDTIEKLKVNFSNGFLKGLEETLKDVIFWVMSWKVWEVYNVRDWIRHLLTLGKELKKFKILPVTYIFLKTDGKKLD